MIIDKTDIQFDDVPNSLDGYVLLDRMSNNGGHICITQEQAAYLQTLTADKRANKGFALYESLIMALDLSGIIPETFGEPTWDSIRTKRDKLLLACDWTQLPTGPLLNDKKIEWEGYRQELRNLPQTYTTPSEVIWPTPPG